MFRELDNHEIIEVAGGDTYEYYEDADGKWLLTLDDNGGWKSEVSLSGGVGGGAWYTGMGFGMDGVAGGITHVWGGDTFAYGGVGTPGFSFETGYTQSGDLSGPSVSVGVPIGPGQLTMDPINGSQMGYTNGFGQFGASATYSVNLNQLDDNAYKGAEIILRMFLGEYYDYPSMYQNQQ